MIGHLGTRVSALLDGQLSTREAEEAWAHVYACHSCRDLVEREGWVKTRLAGLHGEQGAAPSGLKGSLLNMPPHAMEACLVAPGHQAQRRRVTGVALLGGGAVGAAMVGVLALGLAPGSAPGDRDPATRIDPDLVPSQQAPSDRPVPVGHRGGNGPTSGIPANVTAPWSVGISEILGLLAR